MFSNLIVNIIGLQISYLLQFALMLFCYLPLQQAGLQPLSTVDQVAILASVVLWQSVRITMVQAAEAATNP